MKKDNKYYVYKFYNKKNELLYVGQTVNIVQRFKKHAREKEWWKEVLYILYAECKSKSDMDIYEIYYINTLKPKYNISLVSDDTTIQLSELNFIKFEGKVKLNKSYKKIYADKHNKKQKRTTRHREYIYYDFRLNGNDLVILNIIKNSGKKVLITGDIVNGITYNGKALMSKPTLIKTLKNLINYNYIFKEKGNTRAKEQDKYTMNKKSKKIEKLYLDIKDIQNVLNRKVGAEDYKVYTFIKYIEKNNFILSQTDIGDYFGNSQSCISRHVEKLIQCNYIDIDRKVISF